MRKLFTARLRCVAILVAMVICLCSCNQRTPDAPDVSDPEANAFELIQHVYTDEELDEIDTQAQELTLKELHARYPVECLRYVGDESICYICYYTSQDRILREYYDADGELLPVYNHVLTLFDDETVAAISVGESVSQVMERIPDGDYTFLYASWSEFPKISQFYTYSGYCVTVRYDDDMKVSSIDKELF